jgi:hypothetical protein
MGWALATLMEASLRQCEYPCAGEKLNSVLENIRVDMGSLMGGPIHFTPKDHYGTTWWRVFQYDASTKKFSPASDWLEASSTPTLRKQ